MKQIRTKVDSKSEALNLLKILELLGFKVNDCDSAEQYVETHSNYNGVRDVGITTNGRIATWSFSDSTLTLSEFLKEAVERAPASFKTLQLNSEYIAVIEGDLVKVGCQTFPTSKVLELAELIKNK